MRREHFHRDGPIEFRLKPLQHDPHPAAADDFIDVNFPQPANRSGLLGGFEEVNREVDERVGFIRIDGGKLPASGRRFPLGRHLGGMSVIGRPSQCGPDAAPLLVGSGQSFELDPAFRTFRQMLGEIFLLLFAEKISQRVSQQFAIAGVRKRFHGVTSTNSISWLV